MERKESPVTHTPLIVAGREGLPPARQSIWRWRDCIICLAVGLLSALISSYLTLEHFAPRSLNQESSEATKLAQAMRDDWRKQYEEAAEDRRKLERTVANLNAQVAKFAEAIKQHEAQLSTIQAHTPTYADIKETIDHATRTNKGLQNEAVRILGDLGVRRLRVLD